MSQLRLQPRAIDKRVDELAARIQGRRHSLRVSTLQLQHRALRLLGSPWSLLLAGGLAYLAGRMHFSARADTVPAARPESARTRAVLIAVVSARWLQRYASIGIDLFRRVAASELWRVTHTPALKPSAACDGIGAMYALRVVELTALAILLLCAIGALDAPSSVAYLYALPMIPAVLLLLTRGIRMQEDR